LRDFLLCRPFGTLVVKRAYPSTYVLGYFCFVAARLMDVIERSIARDGLSAVRRSTVRIA